MRATASGPSSRAPGDDQSDGPIRIGGLRGRNGERGGYGKPGRSGDHALHVAFHLASLLDGHLMWLDLIVLINGM